MLCPECVYSEAYGKGSNVILELCSSCRDYLASIPDWESRCQQCTKLTQCNACWFIGAPHVPAFYRSPPKTKEEKEVEFRKKAGDAAKEGRLVDDVPLTVPADAERVVFDLPKVVLPPKRGRKRKSVVALTKWQKMARDIAKKDVASSLNND